MLNTDILAILQFFPLNAILSNFPTIELGISDKHELVNF